MIWSSICDDHIWISYWKYYTSVLKNQGMELTREWDDCNYSYVRYHFKGEGINIKVNPIKAKKLIKRVRMKEITKEELEGMSIYESCPLPRW